ncbi:MAG TPA: alpha/beta hydrolase [Patescibacteria group bacterium]|nr:alpha/beta hydrolase [Gammaproteobacteria bacterium]HWA52492.1 alpha/beta hydrolase [Patescibacteria group bacterium]
MQPGPFTNKMDYNIKSQAAPMTNCLFIHGAFQGGWVWDKIKPMLFLGDYTAYFPSLKGSAERINELTEQTGLQEHINDICHMIDELGLTNLTLIGHSYGGMVITGIAQQRPGKVRGLIYLDAVFPETQQSLLDILGPKAANIFYSAAAKGDGWQVQPFPAATFGLTKTEDINWAVPRHTPQALKTFTDKITTFSEYRADVEKTFIHCLQGNAIMNKIAHQAKNKGCHCIEISTPHCPMITHPSLLATILNAKIKANDSLITQTAYQHGRIIY